MTDRQKLKSLTTCLKNPSTKPLKRSQKVKLNVGGGYFVTSRSTLLKFEDSYFAGLMRSGGEPDEDDGAYFIDRNPDHFRKILDYMRTGYLETIPDDEKAPFHVELEYYGIQIAEPNLFELYSHLLEKLMSIESFPTLVWDSHRDPFDEMLSKVMGSPTLIVIKASNGAVFGGYAEGWTPARTCFPERSWVFVAQSTKLDRPTRMDPQFPSSPNFVAKLGAVVGFVRLFNQVAPLSGTDRKSVV